MDSENLVALFHNIGRLKTIERSGWVRCGIPEPESVADHILRTAFMAMMLGDELGVDSKKLVQMVLLHDIAEAVVGDITPGDGISGEEKSRREEEGLKQLLGDIPNNEKYIALWREYEEGTHPESKLARNLDKLEMALQAREYQAAYPEKNLEEFITDAEALIDVPEIVELLREVRKIP